MPDETETESDNETQDQSATEMLDGFESAEELRETLHTHPNVFSAERFDQAINYLTETNAIAEDEVAELVRTRVRHAQAEQRIAELENRNSTLNRFLNRPYEFSENEFDGIAEELLERGSINEGDIIRATHTRNDFFAEDRYDDDEDHEDEPDYPERFGNIGDEELRGLTDTQYNEEMKIRKKRFQREQRRNEREAGINDYGRQKRELQMKESMKYISRLGNTIIDKKLTIKCYVCDKQIHPQLEPPIKTERKVCSKNGTIYNKNVTMCIDCHANKKGYCKWCNALTKLKNLKQFGNISICPRCMKPEHLSRFIRDTLHNHQKQPTELIATKTLRKSDTGNVFGVEIEAIVNHRKLSQNTPTEPTELEKELNTVLKALKHFKITPDGSLSDNGEEFISVPMDFKRGEQILTEFEKEIAKKYLTVNKSCGLHVHLFYHRSNYTPAKIRKLLKGYAKLEDMFFATQPASRKNNQYCQRLTSVSYFRKMMDIANSKTRAEMFEKTYGTRRTSRYKKPLRVDRIKLKKFDSNRYYWINLHSIFCYNTIEIRLHSGTTNAKKIHLWAKAHSELIKYLINAPESDVDKLTPRKYLRKIASPEVKKYIRERIRRHKGNHKFWIDELESDVINELKQIGQSHRQHDIDEEFGQESQEDNEYSSMSEHSLRDMIDEITSRRERR